MRITFLGHAAVLLESADDRLLIDPYESGGFGGKMAYAPIDVIANAVVCSHRHRDHAATDVLPGSPTEITDGEVGAFAIERVPMWHDEYDGRRRGGRVDALDIRCDGVRVVHLSDVGHTPTEEAAAHLRGPDVLLLPVGGYFTIGAAQGWEWQRRLAPKTTIPIHYRTTSCGLPIRKVDDFLAYADEFRRTQRSQISVEGGRSDLPPVIVLTPRQARP